MATSYDPMPHARALVARCGDTLEPEYAELADALRDVVDHATTLEAENARIRENFAETAGRSIARADKAAVSGAAWASRLASNDPEAQAVLVKSVAAIRDPRAFLSRLAESLNEPMSCGHPLECIPDHKPEDAHAASCGWCKDIAALASVKAELDEAQRSLESAEALPVTKGGTP